MTKCNTESSDDAIEELAQHLSALGVTDTRTIALLATIADSRPSDDELVDDRATAELLHRGGAAHVQRRERHDAKRLPAGYTIVRGQLVATPRESTPESRAAEQDEVAAAIRILGFYVSALYRHTPIPLEVLTAVREVNQRVGMTWQRALAEQLRASAVGAEAARVGAYAGEVPDNMSADELALWIVRVSTLLGPPPPPELTAERIGIMRAKAGITGRGRGGAKSAETLVAAFERGITAKSTRK